jgi:hypothetical protein
MMGVTRRQTWKRKDGRRSRGVYRYYQCQSRNNLSTCEYHTWRSSLLEKMVLGQFKYAYEARVSTNGTNGVSHNGTSQSSEIWDNRIKNTERRFLQAMRRTAKGEMSLRNLGEYLDELDSVRRSALNASNPTSVSEMLLKWDSLDFAVQQDFLVMHIARIIVQDESIEVVL